jgi:hypothetical protein
VTDEKTETKERTRYRVYFQQEGANEKVWTEVGVYATTGHRAARLVAFEANGKKPGRYQAWPDRSYDPKTCTLRPTYHEAGE